MPAIVPARLALLAVAGVGVEALLLFLSWPLGVLAGVVGGALFAVVVGLRLQREAAQAPRSDLFDEIAPPVAPAVRRPLAVLDPVAA